MVAAEYLANRDPGQGPLATESELGNHFRGQPREEGFKSSTESRSLRRHGNLHCPVMCIRIICPGTIRAIESESVTTFHDIP